MLAKLGAHPVRIPCEAEPEDKMEKSKYCDADRRLVCFVHKKKKKPSLRLAGVFRLTSQLCDSSFFFGCTGCTTRFVFAVPFVVQP